MSINWMEWLGYIASLIVLVSLLMSSIIRLRLINLMGSCLFSIYGFLIGALPVGFMNLCIGLINIYYLFRIYSSKEYFRLLPVEENSSYAGYFLDFYSKKIQDYMPLTQTDPTACEVGFFILRNMVPAGIFLASRHDEKTLKIELDFVTPEYRDFKVGNFIFEKQRPYFLERGYSQFISVSTNPEHIRYLRKMGFVEKTGAGGVVFIKTIS